MYDAIRSRRSRTVALSLVSFVTLLALSVQHLALAEPAGRPRVTASSAASSSSFSSSASASPGGPAGAVSAGSATSGAGVNRAASASVSSNSSDPLAPPPGLGDLVITDAGEHYRGTLVESTLHEVHLVLPTGKVQTFSSKDITYAGPASGAPKETGLSPRASSTEESTRGASTGARARSTSGDGPPLVTFQAVGDGELTFSINDGTADVTSTTWLGTTRRVGTLTSYRVLCKAPCTEHLVTGTYRMSMSQDGRRPIDAPETVDIMGPTRVTGTYTSNFGWRVTGVLVGLGGLALGIGLVAGSGYTAAPTCPSAGPGSACSFPTHAEHDGMRTAGYVSMILGPLVGAVIYFAATDSVSIEASPLTQALRRVRLGPLVAAESHSGLPGLPRGLTLGAAF